MAHKLESMLRAELCDLLPRYIVQQCIAYGYQSSIALLTRTMRGITVSYTHLRAHETRRHL
eukprot:6000717-Prorocentrum_lima.AAC.1